MIIDIKKIMQSGKDEEDFFFEYEPTDDVVTLPNVKISSPVKVLGKAVLLSGGNAVIDAEVTFTLKGECTRCLADAEKTFTVGFSEEFTKDGSEEGYGIKNGKIDLTKPIDDLILLEMPVSFLCGDCRGIEFN